MTRGNFFWNFPSKFDLYGWFFPGINFETIFWKNNQQNALAISIPNRSCGRLNLNIFVLNFTGSQSTIYTFLIEISWTKNCLEIVYQIRLLMSSNFSTISSTIKKYYPKSNLSITCTNCNRKNFPSQIRLDKKAATEKISSTLLTGKAKSRKKL